MTRRFGAKKWAVGFAPASFALGKKHFDTWFEVASFQFCMFNQRGHVHCCGCNFAMAKQLQPFCRTASLNPSLLYFCHFVFVGSASDWAGTLKVCSWAILELWYNDMLLVRCVTALPAHRSWQNCWIEGVFSFASWLWISCLIMGLLVVCVSHGSNVCDVCLFLTLCHWGLCIEACHVLQTLCATAICSNVIWSNDHMEKNKCFHMMANVEKNRCQSWFHVFKTNRRNIIWKKHAKICLKKHIYENLWKLGLVTITDVNPTDLNPCLLLVSHSRRSPQWK